MNLTFQTRLVHFAAPEHGATGTNIHPRADTVVTADLLHMEERRETVVIVTFAEWQDDIGRLTDQVTLFLSVTAARDLAAKLIAACDEVDAKEAAA